MGTRLSDQSFEAQHPRIKIIREFVTGKSRGARSCQEEGAAESQNLGDFPVRDGKG